MSAGGHIGDFNGRVRNNLKMLRGRKVHFRDIGQYSETIKKRKLEFRHASPEDRKRIRREIEQMNKARIRLAVLSVVVAIIILGSTIIALKHWV